MAISASVAIKLLLGGDKGFYKIFIYKLVILNCFDFHIGLLNYNLETIGFILL